MASQRYEISLLVFGKYFTRSLRSLVKSFSTLEEKFRISKWPFNILYIERPKRNNHLVKMYFLDLEIQRDVHGQANLASPPHPAPLGTASPENIVISQEPRTRAPGSVYFVSRCCKGDFLAQLCDTLGTQSPSIKYVQLFDLTSEMKSRWLHH